MYCPRCNNPNIGEIKMIISHQKATALCKKYASGNLPRNENTVLMPYGVKLYRQNGIYGVYGYSWDNSDLVNFCKQEKISK